MNLGGKSYELSTSMRNNQSVILKKPQPATINIMVQIRMHGWKKNGCSDWRCIDGFEMTDTLIRNIRLFIRGKLREANILIKSGQIEKISKVVSKIPYTGSLDRLVEGRGDLVLPSGIDVHVHFRGMGERMKEDWYTGSCAAAAGGITTVVDHPNTDPPVLGRRGFNRKLVDASSMSIIDFGLNGCACGENIGRLSELWRIGVTSFGEIFMADGRRLAVKGDDLGKALSEINGLGAIACLHAEDDETNQKLKRKYEKNRDPHIHSIIRPPESEEIAIKQALLMGKKTKLHFCHISTKNAVNLIKKEKNIREGLTCEVTPHHLLLSTSEYQRLGTYGKMNPPLRDPEHKSALWNALNEKNIDIIASDHAPHTIEEKETNIHDAPPGVPGVETLIPLMLTAAKQGKISIGRLIETTRLNPAKRFKLEPHGKGNLEAGSDADLIIIDTQNPKTIRGEELYSKATWTPFEGMKGIFPRITMLRGKIIWDDGPAVKKGYGNFLPGAGAI